MNDSTFQTVSESQASPAVSAIYSDIRSTMGVALVNLIWRHLAVEPTVIAWSWQQLKPHYTNGAIPAAAWSLREIIAPAVLSRFTSDECCQLNREIDDLSVLDAVLRTYERGNAQNLIAMCYLRRCIEPCGAIARPSTMPDLSATRRHAEQADRIETIIPPLPGWDELSGSIQQQVSEMSAVWVPSQYRSQHSEIRPSVFRHLAYWPVTLGLFRLRICELQDSADRLSVSSQQAIDRATAYADQLKPASKILLSKADQQWLSEALDLFINGMIARGVVIVPAMRAALVNVNSQTRTN